MIMIIIWSIMSSKFTHGNKQCNEGQEAPGLDVGGHLMSDFVLYKN